jgi:hypothetical protein
VSTAELLVREHAHTDTGGGDVIADLIQLVTERFRCEPGQIRMRSRLCVCVSK